MEKLPWSGNSVMNLHLETNSYDDVGTYSI